MVGLQNIHTPFDDQRHVALYNGGSAEIPAYGCYEIYDTYRPDSAETLVLGGGRTVLKVRRPTSDNVANFGINGPLALPAGQSDGFGTQDYPTYAAYDTANAPAFGEEWGPQSGSCLIKKGNRGLVIYGDASGGIVRVTRSGAPADYDHALASWTTATLDPCPLTPDLVLSGRNGSVVMPSISASIAIPDPTDDSKFAALGTNTLYNPLPFTFVGVISGGTYDYWCSHFGDGKFLMRGPAGYQIIGGSMPSTGSSLSTGFVVWADGNSDGSGHGASGPFVGRVFEVDSGSPTEISITATGPCSYRVVYQLTVSGTTQAFGLPARIVSGVSVSGVLASIIGGSDQQMVGDDSSGAAFTQQLNGTGILTADFGDTIKITCSGTQVNITSVSGRITLEAILPR